MVDYVSQGTVFPLIYVIGSLVDPLWDARICVLLGPCLYGVIVYLFVTFMESVRFNVVMETFKTIGLSPTRLIRPVQVSSRCLGLSV